MRAIISDIHANLEALEAVLADISRQGITEIYCLGDIIGYGPNPRECIDLVMEHCKVCLLGNHDQGAMFDPDGFNIGIKVAGTQIMHRVIFDAKGRIVVMVLHNSDDSDGWEREGENHEYFEKWSERVAYPLAINIICYVMTH